MKTKKKVKEFDCLEFKDKVQEKIYNKIHNLTVEEEKDYFNLKDCQGSFKNFCFVLIILNLFTVT